MQVKLSFLGAAGTVTGSRTLVSAGKTSFLVDAGLFQGDKTMRALNWQPFLPPPVVAKSLPFVVLTHAHLDHSGYLPRLYREGFRGKIFCSPGTADLCRLLLIDAAHLEEESAFYANASHYTHHKPALPMFTEADALGALGLLEPVERETWREIAPGVGLRFLRAGHIIGASLTQLALSVRDQTRILTFSGDLGHERSRFMKPPVDLLETDVLVLESTYGDRLHDRTSVLESLADVINRTAKRGGVLVIPAFAVGRAQELVYLIRLLEDQRAIPELPVILDSPMAIAATEVALRHAEDHLLGTRFAGGSEAFVPRHYEVSRSANDSMLACMRDGPMIVLSAAGMLNGGRILHHLKARLPDERNTVLFAGYQAEGSKGRFLQDHSSGADRVATLRIHHQEVPLEAEIVTIASLSAHADYQDMIEWLSRIDRLPRRIFLNHGTPASMAHLRQKIVERFPKIEVVAVTEAREIELYPKG